MADYRILGLFKFGDREHIDKLVRKGHVYMKPLSYYIRLEATDCARSDRFEGASFWLQPSKAKLQIELDGEFRDIPGLIGPLRYRVNADARVNVYCMHAVQPHERLPAIDPRNFQFGDTYAFFTKPDEFLRRVRKAAEVEGHEVAWQLVRYEDSTIYHGATDVFTKDSKFSYQSEFRIALRPGTGEPLLLKLGDLSDVAMAGELSSVNAHLKIWRTNGESHNI